MKRRTNSYANRAPKTSQVFLLPSVFQSKCFGYERVGTSNLLNSWYLIDKQNIPFEKVSYSKDHRRSKEVNCNACLTLQLNQQKRGPFQI